MLQHQIDLFNLACTAFTIKKLKLFRTYTYLKYGFYQLTHTIRTICTYHRRHAVAFPHICVQQY